MVELLPSAPESSKPAKPASRRSGDPRKRPDPRKRDHRKLIGHTVPRVYTPPLATGEPGPCGCGCALTEATTRGFSAIDFATDVCKVTLRPWQRWLLIHALETVHDEELGLRFRFKNIVTLVARQNGKSTLSVVLSLWAMYARGVRVVLSAAQDLDTAEEIWQAGVNMVEETDDDDEPVRPDLYDLKDRVSLVNGKKALILETGERWKVKAASRKAGRGLSGDLIILDELREQQNWQAWSAITHTTMARPYAQVWCFSNAGDITSVVLRHLRLLAHKILGDPDGIVLAEAERIVQAEADRLGAPDAYDIEQIHEADPDLADLELDNLEISVDDLFLAEWSARPDRSKWDREGWCEANPSLGYGDTTERAVASACGTDPEWEFRTEVLCQWPEGSLTGIYEPGVWEKTKNESIEGPTGEKVIADADKIVGDVRATFDVSRDGSRTYISWAGKRADGLYQGEVVAVRPGTDWVGDWLVAHADRIESVSAQERGAPASDILEQLRKRKNFTIPIMTIGGPRLTAVHGRVAELIKTGKVRHNEQPVLDNSVALAKTKPLGDNEVIDRRRSGGDAAPIISWEFAVFEASEPPTFIPPPPPPPKALSVRDGQTSTRRRRGADNFDPATSGF